MYFDYIWEGPNLKTQFDTVSPTLERVSIFRGKRGGGGGGGGGVQNLRFLEILRILVSITLSISRGGTHFSRCNGNTFWGGGMQNIVRDPP
jgi:hypothetical protein